jgi:hypothetical protein
MEEVKEIPINDLRENPLYKSIFKRLTKEEQEALKRDLKINGQRTPITVNKKLEILDGYSRLQALKELGFKKVKVIIKDLDDIQSLQEAYSTNQYTRTKNTWNKIVAELNFIEAMLKIQGINTPLKDYLQKRGRPRKIQLGESIPDYFKKKKKSELSSEFRTKAIADRLKLTTRTIEYALYVYFNASESIKQGLSEGKIQIKPAYELTKFLQSVELEDKGEQERRKEILINKVLSGELTVHDVNKTVAETNAIKSMLDGESDDVREEVEKELKPLYYTPELDLKEALWHTEETAKTGHVITRGLKRADEIGYTWQEAQKWFADHGGVCLRKVIFWEGEWDKERERLEKQGKIKGEKQNAKASS